MKRFTVTLLGFLLISLGHTVVAQTYPAKPVRILVGFAPGGGTDIMARAVGAKMTESLKQQFIKYTKVARAANIQAD